MRLSETACSRSLVSSCRVRGDLAGMIGARGVMANAVTLGVALELPFQLLFGAW
jgi:hypothetical protein